MAMTTQNGARRDRPPPERQVLERDAEAEGLLRVEEVHEHGALVVRIEIPGVDPDADVDISVTDRVLHVSARRNKRGSEPGVSVYRSEFRYGEFSRDLALSASVQRADITREYAAGILELRIRWPATPVDPPTRKGRRVAPT
jgi:HSP20 family protein